MILGGFASPLNEKFCYCYQKNTHSQEKLYDDIVCRLYVAHNLMEGLTALLSAILKTSECY